jgi:hypothetical protein
MAKARSLVGLDVHATKIVAAVLDAETGELQFFTLGGDVTEAAGLCAGRRRPVRAAYEARPARRGRLALPSAATDRQGAHRAPARPARRGRRDRVERPAAPAHTWTRLEQRAKRRTIIAVAAARELAGFCWAITRVE